jgi:hypothetical protein
MVAACVKAKLINSRIAGLQMSTTSVDGIYAVYITGQSGNGLILMMMRNGKMTGVDPMGVMFDGDYSPIGSGEEWQATVTVKAPPGVTTVQGVSTGPSGITYKVSYVFPKNFEQQKFLEITTQLGPVNAKFQKLRSLPDV